MLKVGLTGGIGAGKSTVARRLGALGAVVIDADLLAREVVAPGAEGLAAVVEAFGAGVLAPDGSLDRAALAARAFADDASRLRLNAILHPRIALRTADLLAAAPADAVVVHDVPLLVENQMGARYHLVIVVHAPVGERVRRLVTERGMSPQDAQARVRAQADDDARRAAADVWLENTATPEALETVVDDLWHRRLLPFEENVRTRRPAPRPAAVVVVPPDPTWPVAATRLVARVQAAVGDVALRVDHIGSTAVPGPAAQDVVDLQLVVADLAAADAVRGALEDAGFARRPGSHRDSDLRVLLPEADPAVLDKRLHAACDPARPVNLHVRAVEGPSWRLMLLLRDWLRAHPHEAAAYATVKGAASGRGAQEYCEHKGPWVTAALRRALAWARATGWQPPE